MALVYEDERAPDGVGYVGAAAPEELMALRLLLEDLGLTEYEAKLLIALIRSGAANATQLAELSGVSRTNVYPRLEALQAKGLVLRHAGKVASWEAVSREAIVAGLREGRERQLLEARARADAVAEEARKALAALIPKAPTGDKPPVQMVANMTQSALLYSSLMSEASATVLVCNRGPYVGELSVDSEVTKAVDRGVAARALYAAPEIDDVSFRATIEAYHAAGVDGRVLPDVPFSAAIFDGNKVLLSFAQPDIGQRPTYMLVEYPGFGAWCTAAFDHLWATAKPYDTAVRPAPGRRLAAGAKSKAHQ